MGELVNSEVDDMSASSDEEMDVSDDEFCSDESDDEFNEPRDDDFFDDDGFTGKDEIVEMSICQSVLTSKAGCEIREVIFSDPDNWPVLKWVPQANLLRMDAANMHEFCVRYGVYHHCEKLSAQSDQQAAIIPQETTKSTNGVNNGPSHRNSVSILAPSTPVRFDDRFMKRVANELLKQVVHLR